MRHLFALPLAGCLNFPDEAATLALDTHLDRPRVVAIRLEPPWVYHGTPVTVRALAVGPSEVRTMSAALCGIRDDVAVRLSEGACFQNEDLIQPIEGALPVTFDPPDLSVLGCTPDTGFPETGIPTNGECFSRAPLMVTADFAEGPAYGLLELPLRHVPGAPPLFTPIANVPLTLSAPERAAAGSDVPITLSIDAEPDGSGLRWYADAGVFLGTGRTIIHRRDGETRISTNTLRLPRDARGPVRVVAVVPGPQPHPDVVGNFAWAVTTITVEPPESR